MKKCPTDRTDFDQCCCECRFHIPDHKHCITVRKKPKGTCVCNVRKGWICMMPGSKVAYSRWPSHSVGCEMFTRKGRASR